mmetsp:Transcript_10680/g.23538  ORF Transcript_10680/g.23538 Transcript_10680/m.23538 type:complete len:178 (+) Transcript_10680:59-592(+)
MPATAGRSRMPANNRLSTSDSLNTHGIWQKTVGYDPYAGEGEQEQEYQNYTRDGEINQQAKGLFELARLTGNSSSVLPGACKHCNQVGHLAFQCRNKMSMQPAQQTLVESSDDEDKDAEELEQGLAGLSSSSEDEDASMSSASSSPKKKKKKKDKKAKKKKKKDKKEKKVKKKKSKK